MGLKTSYFDCCAGFGYFQVADLKPAPTRQDLLAEMDTCGIERALVYHATQVDGSPVLGNRVVLEETAGIERLEASWAILPPETGEFPAPEDLPAEMRKAGVRSLRAFPENHRYLLSPNSLSGLLALIAERRIPLFLRKAPWQQVEALLMEFPDLTLIACAHGPWGDDRFFRPLLDRYDRFFVDTSRYELNGGIKDLCRTHGHSRLLFGTCFPSNAPGGPRLTLDGADISEDARCAIASGNLERILSEAELT